LESITAQAWNNSLNDWAKRFRTYQILPRWGSALCLLGSPRETLDIDYFIDGETVEVEQGLKEDSTELKLDLESVPI